MVVHRSRTELKNEIQRLRLENKKLREALEVIQRPQSGTWRELYERARDVAFKALYG